MLQALHHWRSITPIRLIQLFGLCLFAIAFFLPACDIRGYGSDDPLHGWQCAWLTLRAILPTASRSLMVGYWRPLLILSGLASPLTVVYIAFSATNLFDKARLCIAIAILICLAAASAYLVLAQLIVLPGHYLWTSGTILILSPQSHFSRSSHLRRQLLVDK